MAKGEPLFELDTDKVTQEVEADSEGVLLKIVIADGEVDVGTTVGIIGSQDEDVSELVAAPSDNGDAPATEARGGRERGGRGGRRGVCRAGRGRTRRVGRAGHAGRTRAIQVKGRARARPRFSDFRACRRRACEGQPARAPHRARAWGRPRAGRGDGAGGPRDRRGRREGRGSASRAGRRADRGGRSRGRRAHEDAEDDRAPPHGGLAGAGIPAHGLGRRDRARRDARADGRAAARGRDEADGLGRPHAARRLGAHAPPRRSTPPSSTARSIASPPPTSDSRSRRRAGSSSR